MSNRRTRTLRTATLSMALAALLAPAAFAHLKVLKNAPKNGEELGTSVSAVQVWFSEAPDVALSKLELVGPNGPIELDKVESTGDKDLKATVKGSMPAGKYEVRWQTAGDDGHVQKGSWTFTLAPTSH